jgi:cell wall-associated NlpC family hydrolase
MKCSKYSDNSSMKKRTVFAIPCCRYLAAGLLLLFAVTAWAQSNKAAEAATAASEKAFEAMTDTAPARPASGSGRAAPGANQTAEPKPSSAASDVTSQPAVQTQPSQAQSATAPVSAAVPLVDPDSETKAAAIAALAAMDENAPELDIEAFLRTRITLVAQQYLGVPYKAAGINPNGFDCSGFVYFAYREAAGMELSRSTVGLWTSGKAVASKDVKPGDVLIFTTVRAGASHAGIVIENGERGIVFIHAASQGSKTGVIISRLNETYYRSRFMGARTYF